MDKIHFVSEFSPIIDDENYSFILPPVKSEEDFFNVYNAEAHFPYFGYNWDSLSELIEDFYWINQPCIRIYHESIASLNDEDLAVYLRIVHHACDWWKNYPKQRLLRLYEWLRKEPGLEFFQIWDWWTANPEHTLNLFFNKKDEEIISKVERSLIRDTTIP